MSEKITQRGILLKTFANISENSPSSVTNSKIEKHFQNTNSAENNINTSNYNQSTKQSKDFENYLKIQDDEENIGQLRYP